MKIDRAKYEEAYRVGKLVHEGAMRGSEAERHLAATGLNPNSAMDYVYALRQMLKGHRYERTLSSSATEDFLLWIQRDFGAESFKKAVAALQQHIEYYQSLTNVPMRSHVAVFQKYCDVLDEDTGDFISPEEIEASDRFDEGETKQVTVNIYERNAKARKACLELYGYVCSVCSFDFEKKFGAIGRGFIHVHHLRDLATIGKAYKINPKEDLRPVCPNCHAMLHKSKPAYKIDELKRMISAQTTGRGC